jgi:hypothetical protein
VKKAIREIRAQLVQQVKTGTLVPVDLKARLEPPVQLEQSEPLERPERLELTE